MNSKTDSMAHILPALGRRWVELRWALPVDLVPEPANIFSVEEARPLTGLCVDSPVPIRFMKSWSTNELLLLVWDIAGPAFGCSRPLVWETLLSKPPNKSTSGPLPIGWVVGAYGADKSDRSEEGWFVDCDWLVSLSKSKNVPELDVCFTGWTGGGSVLGPSPRLRRTAGSSGELSAGEVPASESLSESLLTNLSVCSLQL